MIIQKKNTSKMISTMMINLSLLQIVYINGQGHHKIENYKLLANSDFLLLALIFKEFWT